MSSNSQEVINLEFRQIANLEEVLPNISIYKDIKRLSLHGNRLKSLPRDLSSIAQIEYLDISGNLFKGPIDGLVSSLNTLPRLKELVITLNSPGEELQIIKGVPSLDILNGTRILKDRVKLISDSQQIPMAKAGENLNRLSGSKIGTNLKPNDKNTDKIFPMSLNDITNSQTSAFHETIDSNEIQTVLALYDALSQLKNNPTDIRDMQEHLHSHLSNILMDLDVNSKQLKHRLAKEIHLLKARFALIDIVFHNYIGILSEDSGNPFKSASQTILSTFYSLLNQIFKGFIDLAILMEPKSESSFDNLREKVRKTIQEPSSAIDRSEKLIKHNEEILRAWQTEVKALHAKVIELQEDMKSVEAENKVLLEKLIKHTKEKLDEAEIALPKEKTKSPLNDSFGFKNDHRIPSTSPNINKIFSKAQKNPKKLDNLKETMDEIYDAKVLADQKNEEASNPKETLEQFMYSYFKNKFGLKNLVADHAEQVILGIQSYKDYDVGVFIFGKMLRNEIDENYFTVYRGLKKTVVDSLKLLLQKKNPYHSQVAINAQIEKLKQGEKLPKDDLLKIANFILGSNKKDFDLFAKLLGGESEISIRDFEEKLCHYRLMKYEAGIKPFNLLFKKIDENGSGVLRFEQLEDLVSVLNKITESRGCSLDVHHMASKLDPGKFDKITYSQIVGYLLSISIEHSGRNVSYIQFLKLITK